jgi:chromosome segregation ATPase
LLTTARAQCPFCEGQERAQGAVDGEESRKESEPALAGSLVGSVNEAGDPDSSHLVLEELERKASAIRALEAEAEAREAKAQERLRQVEARLREEMSRRSELQRKSQEIELELKRPQEVSHSHLEAVRATSEAAARFEEERNARLTAEQVRVEAEAKALEMEARASEAEERLRQIEAGLQQADERLRQAEAGLQQADERLRQAEARLQQEASKRASAEQRLQQSEAGLQQEASKRTSAEERANELEVRFAGESAKIRAEAEAKIQGIGAETRRIEENYKAEIDWIRGELESSVAEARQAGENHKAEISRITFEAESRVYQAESNARQYQIKVEEAIASAQAAMFNLEETQKKLEEAEAAYREMEIRARQAETRSHRLYLISKLTFTSAEQVIAEALNAGYENEKESKVISLNGATTAPLDNLSTEITELAANGSMDYGEYPFTDRMKALFQAAARANAPEDKSGNVGIDELRLASGE